MTMCADEEVICALMKDSIKDALESKEEIVIVSKKCISKNNWIVQ